MADFMAVDKIHNPKSANDGMWVVYEDRGNGKRMEAVYMSRRKKDCVEFAKAHSKAQHVSNGVEYGARW